MTQLTLKGKPFHTMGNLPKIGDPAPNFTLTKTDLSEISLQDLKGKKIILSIFPSLDTPTCAASMRKFNELATKLDDVIILCVSADLPFAQKRFCGAERLDNVISASMFRHPEFGKNYGVMITDGPLAGLLTRVVIIIDEQGKVSYVEQVAEIADEPAYQAALSAVS